LRGFGLIPHFSLLNYHCLDGRTVVYVELLFNSYLS
jgi:hypothetical protein